MDDSYVAGIVDADGCIVISKTFPKSRWKQGSKSPDYRLHVEVCNTNYALMELLVESFGGSISHKPMTKGSFFTRREHYNWSVSANQAYLCLKRIQPYLIVKRNQSDIAMEFWEKRTHMAVGKSHRLTETELALREGYYQAMKKLKNP